jgi:hypothetical protein
MVVFILDLFGFIFFPEHSPRWLRFVSGTTLVGALVSGVTCIVAAIFGRIKSGGQIVQSHEKDAAS